MTDQNTYLIVGDDGQPIGVANMDQITDHGTKYAFDLAANCADPQKARQIGADLLLEIGPDAFGYACANAVQVLATEILSPCLDVAAAAGQNLRPGITALAEGRDPMEAGR